jgi:hypothetical protein
MNSGSGLTGSREREKGRKGEREKGRRGEREKGRKGEGEKGREGEEEKAMIGSITFPIAAVVFVQYTFR